MAWGHLNSLVHKLRTYEQVTGFSQIARRAFANNAFDGVLTMLGVLMGNYLGHVRSPATVVRIGVATSISIGVSGLWGAYLAESAERERDLRDLERLSLVELGDTEIGRAYRVAVMAVSMVDGVAPLISSLVVLAPFLFTSLWRSIMVSYVLSLIVATGALFGLGAFLGHISGRSLIGYGLRTVLAGVVTIAINALLPLD
jgi:predicted membrane protein (TIGR00267 family)